MKKVFRGTSHKGKLVLDDQKGFDLLVWSLNGKEVEVTVGKKVKRRSNNQNAYFHSVIIKMISDATGYDVHEAKEMMRALFLSYSVKVGNDIIKIGRSTASLSTTEFETLNSKCRQWASETLDIFIPDPNQVEY